MHQFMQANSDAESSPQETPLNIQDCKTPENWQTMLSDIREVVFDMDMEETI